MKHISYILLTTLTITFLSCGAYSFTGADVGSAKTFQVNYFQNNALLVEPGLDRDFTLALQDLIQNQTNLSLVNSGGDLIYEGEITEYRISPTTAQANSTAAQNRLTIGVKVNFINTKKEDADFDKNFSFFFDYPGTGQLVGAQKDAAFEEIFERLTQDIFNASLADW
jgi:hypothetical protein